MRGRYSICTPSEINQAQQAAHYRRQEQAIERNITLAVNLRPPFILCKINHQQCGLDSHAQECFGLTSESLGWHHLCIKTAISNQIHFDCGEGGNTGQKHRCTAMLRSMLLLRRRTRYPGLDAETISIIVHTQAATDIDLRT